MDVCDFCRSRLTEIRSTDQAAVGNATTLQFSVSPECETNGAESDGAFNPDTSSELSSLNAPPLFIGRYEVKRALGEGGFGIVYLAYDTALARQVAIKVIRQQRSTSFQREEFLREARLLASLDHPKILPVLDMGYTASDQSFVVSKYLQGADLNQRNRVKPLSFDESAIIILQIAEALQHAHQRGVIHRDIKPANILLDGDGNALLCDFGLAIRDGQATSSKLAGTPAFMSPEQARGDNNQLDGRSDIYSLGATFYHLLAGRTPFRGSSAQVIHSIATLPVRPPRQWKPTIPVELERICMKCLAHSSSERYLSAADLIADLHRYLDIVRHVNPKVANLVSVQKHPLIFDFTPIIRDKVRAFTGRDWLHKEVQTWLGSRSMEKLLIIQADPGWGKSAFAASLAQDQSCGCVAFHFFQADTPGTLEPWRIVKNISAMLAESIPEYDHALTTSRANECLEDANCRADPASAFEFGILAPLHSIDPTTTPTPRFLLLDALDEGLCAGVPQDFPSLLETRLSRFPSWLRIVATSRREPVLADMFSQARMRNIESNERGNLTDLKLFTQEHFNRDTLMPRTEPIQTMSQEQLLEQLLDRAGGNFLYLRQLVAGLEYGTYLAQDLKNLPNGLEALFQVGFKRLFPNAESFREAQIVLETICAAATPLSESEIAEFTELDIESTLPETLDRLAPYLKYGDDAVNSQRVTLFHKSLFDWLVNPSRRRTPFHTNIRRGCQRIIDRCWHVVLAEETATHDYCLSNLATHLIETSDFEKLYNLLTSFRYLDAKVKIRLGLDLVKELALAEDLAADDDDRRYALQILKATLVKNLHFLEQWSGSLYQVLYNDLSWLACTCRNSKDLSSKVVLIDALLEEWKSPHRRERPNDGWLRSLLPPSEVINTTVSLVLRGHRLPIRAICYERARNGFISATNEIRVWSLPFGQLVEMIESPQGLIDKIEALGDDRIAVLSSDGTARVYETATMQVAAEVPIQHTTLYNLAVSIDGCYFATVTKCRKLQLWSTDAMDLKWEVETPRVSISSLTFSNSGEVLVGGCSDGSICVWRVADAVLEKHTRVHSDRILSIVCGGRDRIMVSTSLDNTVELHRLGTWENLLRVGPLATPISSIALSPDEGSIVIGMMDGTAHVHNALTGNCLHRFAAHVGPVNTLRFSSKGDLLASGGEDMLVKVWNWPTLMAMSARIETSLQPINGTPVRALGLDINGKLLAIGRTDGSLELRELETGTVQWKSPSQPQPISSGTAPRCSCIAIAISPDCSQVAVATEEQEGLIEPYDSKFVVRLIEATNGEEKYRVLPPGRNIESLAYSNEGTILKVVGTNRVTLFDATSGNLNLAVPMQRIWLAKLIADENIRTSPMLVTVSKGGVLDMWELQSQTLSGSVGDIGKGLEHFIVDRSARSIIAAYADGTLRKFDIDNAGDCTSRILGVVNPGVTCLESRPRSDEFIVGSQDGSLSIWSSSGMQRSLDTLGSAVRKIKFSPDGNSFLTVQEDKLVHIHSIANSSSVQRLDSRGMRILAAEFSADDSHLILLTSRQILRWKREDGSLQLLPSIEAPNQTQFRSFVLSPSSSRLAVYTTNEEASTTKKEIWWIDLESEKCEERWPVTEAIEVLSFADGGRILLTQATSDRIQFWNTQTGSIVREIDFALQNEVDNFALVQNDSLLVGYNAGSPIRVWEVANGRRQSSEERLGIALNSIPPLQNEASAFSLLSAKAEARSRTTLFVNSSNHSVLAYPVGMRNIVHSSNARVWAGSEGADVFALKWEGRKGTPINELPTPISDFLSERLNK